MPKLEKRALSTQVQSPSTALQVFATFSWFVTRTGIRELDRDYGRVANRDGLKSTLGRSGRKTRIDQTRRNRNPCAWDLEKGQVLVGLTNRYGIAVLVRASHASLECTLGSNRLGYKYESKSFIQCNRPTLRAP